MNFEKLKIHLTILKLKGTIFYMRYIKIFILAVVDIIVDLYEKRRK